MDYRVGVDVGGTFTDVLLVDEDGSRSWRTKTPSTPHDQSQGVLKGILEVCELAGIQPGEVVEILHGTTVATNAILEGKGAKVGLVTTEGFRHVLQIARSFVPGGLGGWIIWPKPEPPADLEHTVAVRERIGADGQVIIELDEEDVRQQVRKLGDKQLEAIAISLINSYANPSHERRVGEIVEEELPGLPVSLSTAVLPEMREYERTLTTVANSYVQPQVGRYLSNLERALDDEGFSAELLTLRSDGGLMSIDTAVRSPVNLLMSGPAGGVAGAVWFAEQAGYRNLLTLDMGGTSADVALVQDLEPQTDRDTTVGDLKVRATSIDVRTVGAGGGSIAHVPPLTQALRVGPQSAGADPGPAAYGQGGEEPTVTDANFVLGFLPDKLAGGELSLDRDLAHQAVTSIASGAGIDSVEEAATGIIDIVNENLLGALRLVSTQQGYDPRDFALVAFGGAGPLHANDLGRLTGSWPVIIPPSPGILAAYGDVTTGMRDEASRTWVRQFDLISDADVTALLDELAEEAAISLNESGVPPEDRTLRYFAEVRYHGQGFEIPIELDRSDFTGNDRSGLAGLAERFREEHERLFSFSLHNEEEIVAARVTVSGPRAGIDPEVLEAGGEDPPEEALATQTQIWLDGGHHTANVWERKALLAGNRISGPAIIVEMDSTTLVLPDYHATVHPSGCLLLEPSKE